MPLDNLLSFATGISAFGLDIGNCNVKAVQLAKKPFSKQYNFTFGIARIAGEDKINEAIMDAYKEARIAVKDANIAISAPNIIIRYITMPYMEKSSLSRALEFEQDKYIPSKKEEMLIQHSVLGKIPNNQMMILLAAIPRSTIEKYLDIIKATGLTAKSITVDSLALIDSFKEQKQYGKTNDFLAVLDIGFRSSKLIIFKKETPYFSRDIACGGDNFNKSISQKFGIETNQAEKLRHNPPQDKTNDIIDAIKPQLNILFEELRLSFEYCERCLQEKVTRLFLVGGDSKVAPMDNLLSDRLGIKVSHWDPCESLGISPPLEEKLKESGHLLGVAIGLALQN